jgi:hypothetical protein
MLESKDHQQIVNASGALDLTFASSACGRQVANVKSAPLTGQTNQMCPIGADFKHFRAPENRRISRAAQYLVNHASQGVVNHARKSDAGHGRLTRLFKAKRKACG